jgi:uncharacterized protein (DUF433 family)
MAEPIDLLARPVYGIAQVDGLLGLSAGTARRWIEGYERNGKAFPPVVRERPTGDELVTWGEFAEARLLAEYRKTGVPMVHMRPAVDALRDELNVPYPLAYASPWLEAEGNEIVRRVQDKVGLKAGLRFVVVRNNQISLNLPIKRFVSAVDWGEDEEFAQRINPFPDKTPDVWFDPLRRSGDPTVRATPTAVLFEQFRSGDSVAMLARIYELSEDWIEQAIRYELLRRGDTAQAA